MVSDPLKSWHDGLFFLLLGLSDRDLKDSGVRLDYSRHSFAELEQEILKRFASPNDLERIAPPETLNGLTAYVGETLMRAAGGKWSWGQNRPALRRGDGPVVCADPALALAPVAPLDLVIDAVAARSGDRLTQAFDRWLRAVAAHRATDPSWRPEKERTMADDPKEETDALRAWLDEQEAGFPAWVADYGADLVWDFDPATLPVLEEVLRGSVPSPAELGGPERRRFRDGAAWYLGETFRRHLGGRWTKLQKAGNRNFPFVKDLGPRQSFRITPVLALESAIAEPASLSKRFVKVSES